MISCDWQPLQRFSHSIHRTSSYCLFSSVLIQVTIGIVPKVIGQIATCSIFRLVRTFFSVTIMVAILQFLLKCPLFLSVEVFLKQGPLLSLPHYYLISCSFVYYHLLEGYWSLAWSVQFFRSFDSFYWNIFEIDPSLIISQSCSLLVVILLKYTLKHS